jgi:hypothetical protein
LKSPSVLIELLHRKWILQLQPHIALNVIIIHLAAL